MNSWKAFSASCWFVKASSLQKVVEMLKEVVVGLARGQVNVVDEAKLHSTIDSTFEALVV